MKKPTLSEIKNAMERLKMRVFTADFDCTLGGIRDSNPYSNTFNDYIFLMYHEKRVLKGVVVEGTVDGGLSVRLNPTNPSGMAIIANSYQFLGAYQLKDPKLNPKLRGHKGRKAFRQVGQMLYWRDNNKDAKADFGGELLMGNFQTNGHSMGVLGKEVNGWSEGCWGATEANMQRMFDVAQKQIDAGLGNYFSYAQLHEYDVFPAWQKEGCNLY